MSRQKRSTSTPAPPVDSHALKFVSRAEQLRLRGQRNYSRYMLVVKKFVKSDSLERAQWQKEFDEEDVWDAEWNKRHGLVPGGARILPLRHEHERDLLHAEVPSPSTEVVV
jgi:hypothetical protein